jgi:hypothetical protein
MPVISIVTAVLAGKHQYLSEAYESLTRQIMPAGWTWQWLVQEDGETGVPLAELPGDPRISTGTGAHGRPPMARTLALSRAEGVLVRALDADDVLPGRALYRDITTLMDHPEVGWCVSPALDLLPGGELRRGPRDPDPGPLPDRLLADGEEAGLLPVLGVTMCAYADLVRLLGGWPATRSEDVGLLLAAEAIAPGWMLAEPGLHYRRWPGSATSNIDKRLASEEEPHRSVSLDRAALLRAAGWRWTPSAVMAGRP